MKDIRPFTKERIGRGASYIFLENIVILVSSYAFWILVTRLTSPEIVGLIGTIVSFSSVIAIVVGMGIPLSLQRFLGKNIPEKKYTVVSNYVLSSIIVLILTSITCALAIWFSHRSISDLLGVPIYSDSIALLTIIFIISSSFVSLFRGILISFLDTRLIAIATILSTIMKFVITFLLIKWGFGETGLLIGLVSFSVADVFVMSRGIRECLGDSVKSLRNLSGQIFDLAHGGIANWIPALLTSLGTQLGTVLVYSMFGAVDAGLYFIAFSVFIAVFTMTGIIFAVTYPVLNSIANISRPSVSGRLIRLSVLFTTPLTFSIFFFSSGVMSLFGDYYADAAYELQTLLLSIAPTCLILGITNLVYSYGSYKTALGIGISFSVPRIVLYFILVPFMGGDGAALSVTIGTVIGMLYSIKIAHSEGVPLDWQKIVVVVLISAGVGTVISLLIPNFIIGIVLTFFIPYFLFIRTKLMFREDVEDILKVFPAPVSGKFLRITDAIGKKISSTYAE